MTEPVSKGIGHGLYKTSSRYRLANLLNYSEDIVEQLDSDGHISEEDLEPDRKLRRPASAALEPLVRGGVLVENGTGYDLSEDYDWCPDEAIEAIETMVPREL
ncbi:MAG: hypothetical protein ABEJ99_04950 [Candidatus Nanohaloarchaea archaeon]